MKKAVVTDGITMNPGDLSWEKLRSIVRLSVYERTKPEEMAERCRDADFLIVNKTPINKSTLSLLPKLSAVFVTATGYNNIDTEALAFANIALYNVKGYSSASVAQHTMACILHHANQLHIYFNSVREGNWQHAKDFSYSIVPIESLATKKLGVVGFGPIGRELASLGRSFGMELYVHSSFKQTPQADIHFSDLNTLLREADYVCLNTKLTPEKVDMINAQSLGMMKNSAVLINVARAQLVCEEALYKALRKQQIAAAYLDVLHQEPPTKGNPLIELPNCFVTPHIAWSSRQARNKLLNATISNIQNFLAGKKNNNRIL